MLHSKTFGNGPNLVLLHGWGMNSAVWEDTAQTLAADFKVTLIDLPGHGYSDFKNSDKQNLQTWAKSCLEVAPPQAVWIGWSLGGTVTLAAVAQAPQHFQGLILVTATPCFLQNANWPHGMRSEILGEFKKQLAMNWVEVVDNFLTLQVRGSSGGLSILRSLRQCLAKYPSPRQAALYAGLDILRDTDLSSQLASLQLPNLWIYGNRDTLIPYRSSETLRQLLPTAQTSIIQGAAHAPFLSHKEQFLNLLREFIKTECCT